MPSCPFQPVWRTAARRAQPKEFRVRRRSNNDFEGIQWGSRRKREMCLSVCTCC